MTLKLKKEQIEGWRNNFEAIFGWPENKTAVNALCDQALLAITLTQQLKDKEAELVQYAKAMERTVIALEAHHFHDRVRALHRDPHCLACALQIDLKQALAATPTQGSVK